MNSLTGPYRLLQICVKILLSLSLVALPLTAHAEGYLGWLTCWTLKQKGPLRETVAIQGTHPSVPVPIGVRSEHFKAFVESLLRIELTDSVIFWGSRTHFHTGYPPTTASDLDMHVFRNLEPQAIDQRKMQAISIRLLLNVFNRETGIKAAESLPHWEHSLATTLAHEPSSSVFRYPENAEIEDSIFKQGAEKSRGFFTTRQDRKKAVLEILGNTYDDISFLFNKEAIIFIKNSPSAIATEQKLKEYGFKNVFIVQGE